MSLNFFDVSDIFGIKTKVENPQRIFLEVLKSDGTTCIISGDIKTCSINVGPSIQLTLVNISKHDTEKIRKKEKKKCDKCEGSGFTYE
jgi:DnaJ-class molecular chaperone